MIRFIAASGLVVSLLVGCASSGYRDVRSWAIQLQGLEYKGAVDALEAARVDLVVIESTATVKGSESFPLREVVARLQRSPGETRSRKLCVAYFNIGQAESYRTYWGADWKPPAGDQPGNPAFLITTDQDGWVGNFDVAFWRERWRALVLRRLDRLLEAGFDGVFLDGVLIHETPLVVAAAEVDRITPAKAMVELLTEVRDRGQSRKPGFFTIALNSAELSRRDPNALAILDMVCQEDLSFSGDATDDWSNPKSGDIPADPALRTELLPLLRTLRQNGIPVLTLDYALKKENAAASRARARKEGFLPFVSRTPLDRLPDHR